MAAALLPRLVGRKRAFEILMTGASLTAADAERIGLITRACPTTGSRRRWPPSSSASRSRARRSCSSSRRAIAGGLDLPYEDAVRHAEDVYLNQLLNTQDVEEGLRAVAEKRKPAWKDR